MQSTRPSNRALILILGALTTVSPFSIDMYLPAFSQIASALDTTAAEVSLSLSSYFIGVAVGQVFYGPLLDRYGRKRPVYGGLSLYILASIGCLLAHSVESLVFWRFVQALGGCVAAVASMAMVRDLFPPQDSAKVFSLMMLVLGVSPLLAPTFGGFVTAWLGWQWVFVTLVTIVGTILFVTATLLPESHTPDPTVSLRPLPILRSFQGGPQSAGVLHLCDCRLVFLFGTDGVHRRLADHLHGSLPDERSSLWQCHLPCCRSASLAVTS